MRIKRISLVVQHISAAMAVAIFLGCGLPQAMAYGAGIAAVDVQAEVTPDSESDAENAEVLTDFAVRLLQQAIEDDTHTLVSPYSLISALSMTANGAAGKTLSQMEEVLGLSVDEINQYIKEYQAVLAGDKENRLSIANSIWLKEDDSLEINETFLQTNEEYYEADIYETSMTEESLPEINGWVNEKTDGMISEILQEIPENAVMYLINALAFDAEWQTPYTADEVRSGTFTREDGTQQEIELMYSEEYAYLEDNGAVGFLKNYKNGKYSFAALLPEEGTGIEDYVENLTGERLHSILSNKQECLVDAAIPKFKTEFTGEMSEVLKKMGMVDAFSENEADFSNMCTTNLGNVYIGRVLHKTFMEVNENGTKAGAASAVEMLLETAAEEPETAKIVHLDRPFVYLLIDREQNLPIFIGTAMQIDS